MIMQFVSMHDFAIYMSFVLVLNVIRALQKINKLAKKTFSIILQPCT